MLVFGIGHIRTTFQAAGKCLWLTRKLMIFVNGGARSSATILISLAGMWSAPVELSVRRLWSSRRTAFRLTGSISNASGVSGGRDAILKVHYVFRRVSFIKNNASSAFSCCRKVFIQLVWIKIFLSGFG